MQRVLNKALLFLVLLGNVTGNSFFSCLWLFDQYVSISHPWRGEVGRRGIWEMKNQKGNINFAFKVPVHSHDKTVL